MAAFRRIAVGQSWPIAEKQLRSSKAVRQVSASIVSWPHAGIPRTPYVAAYIVMADRIRILRVLHGAQMWPIELGGE